MRIIDGIATRIIAAYFVIVTVKRVCSNKEAKHYRDRNELRDIIRSEFDKVMKEHENKWKSDIMLKEEEA